MPVLPQNGKNTGCLFWCKDLRDEAEFNLGEAGAVRCGEEAQRLFLLVRA